MGISKITLEGVTQIDTTGVTVDAAHLLSGYTALNNAGVLITGTYTSGPTYKLTKIGTNNAKVTYKGTDYTTAGSSFYFTPGETCVITVQYGATYNYIYVDDVAVAGGTSSSSYTYEYTLPSYNVQVNGLSGGQGDKGIARVNHAELDITANGQYDVTDYSVADVDLPSGTEGTPVATKGTVSNHSVTVTPSVTNTAGVITGGTHTGTAVTVSASELDSGTKSISANGTGIDVVGYAAVDVAVPAAAQYTAKITGNSGTGNCYARYNSTQYYSDGAEFDFVAGDTCTLHCQANSTIAEIYVDGVKVANSGQSQAVNYNYTLPSHNIEIKFSYGTSSSTYVTPYTLEITSNGEYDVTDYAVADVNVSGGAPATVDNHVRFIDYDGTVLYSYTPAEFAELSALPANPSHTGLTAQGWNWTKQQIDDYLDDYPNSDVWVGQMYITASGKTEIDVRFEDPTLLSPYLSIHPKGTVVVDWGDGSATDTITGSSVDMYAQHTYSQIGSYTIALTASSGSFTFYASGNTNYSPILMKNAKASGNYNRSYGNCIREVRLGDGITTLGSYAFGRCYSLTSITIPSTITSMSSGAFDSCRSLTSITLPREMSSIESSLLNTCQSLTSVSIPHGITSIGSSAFSGCYSLTSIMIPDTVTSISSNAFSNCLSIPSITIPDTVTSIGSSVFQYCYALTSITIPSTVTSIGSSAFSSCYSLASINIPDNITSIGASVFSNCYSLTSINIPDNITSIGNSAFNTCISLTSITIPDTVTSIGSNVFAGCTTLKHIIIPNECEVGRNIFQGCALLTSLPVPLPSNATDIKANEFNGCNSLGSITIPDTVTSIGSSAFNQCYSLASITIPDGVTSIGSSAFYYCYSLTSLTIPDTVTSIGNSAFNYCADMKEYHFQRTTPPTLGGSSVFGSIPSDCIIYVPYSADHSVLNAYQTASNWSTHASKMQEEPQS